jgi:hypothetical protein
MREVQLAHILAVEKSIEPKGRSKLIIIHTGKIVSGINVPCPAKEELLECLGSART